MSHQPAKSSRYFVNEKCLSCEACWKAAPQLFASHPIETQAYVVKEPASLQEVILYKIVQKLCPAGAIQSAASQEDEASVSQSAPEFRRAQ